MTRAQQLTTFSIDSNLYGIDVQVVQEVTKGMKLTPVPLAPGSVAGLLNLRGQIATAVSLRKLFNMENEQGSAEQNFVICRHDGLLVALLVDEIGDVIDVAADDFEETPETMPDAIKICARGIYKLPQHVLTVIDFETISENISKTQKGEN